MKKGLIISGAVVVVTGLAVTGLVIKCKKVFKENLMIDLLTARKYLAELSDETVNTNFDKVVKLNGEISDILTKLGTKEWYTVVKLQEASLIVMDIVLRANELKNIEG